jgi:hypothetical protein
MSQESKSLLIGIAGTSLAVAWAFYVQRRPRQEEKFLVKDPAELKRDFDIAMMKLQQVEKKLESKSKVCVEDLAKLQTASKSMNEILTRIDEKKEAVRNHQKQVTVLLEKIRILKMRGSQMRLTE